jgi:hypothetical protein
MNEDFLQQLQKEAKLQQKLYSSRIIPKAFDPLTSFIGENSFVSLVFLSLMSAVIIELINIL